MQSQTKIQLTREDLDALRKLSTPTVANAIELFDLRPRSQGFMSPAVRSLFPEMSPLVGYAVTARFAALRPAEQPGSRYELWKYILEFPEPRVLVMQDLDRPTGVGAYFGEVQATVHKRLGCAGVVTDGCVRDLDEVRALGFQFFAAGACVSHAYVHLVDFGGAVQVGGLTVEPGDIVHADQHGVLCLPASIAREIPQAAARVAEREQRILDLCKSPDFTLEKLKEVFG